MPTAEVLCLVPSGNTISVPTVISLSNFTLGVNVITELSAESIVVPTKVTEPVIAAPEMVIALNILAVN